MTPDDRLPVPAACTLPTAEQPVRQAEFDTLFDASLRSQESTAPTMSARGSVVGDLRSGQVAAAAGVNVQTLRYYERLGLLAEPPRTSGGHRLYPAEAVTLLRVIKAAQRLGFTLDEVADLVDTGRRQHRGSDAGLRGRAQAKLAEIEERITDLQVIAGTLRAAIDAGCDDLVTCSGQTCCPIPFAALAVTPTEGSSDDLDLLPDVR